MLKDGLSGFYSSVEASLFPSQNVDIAILKGVSHVFIVRSHRKSHKWQQSQCLLATCYQAAASSLPGGVSLKQSCRHQFASGKALQQAGRQFDRYDKIKNSKNINIILIYHFSYFQLYLIRKMCL